MVPVETATAERKTMPVQLRALGSVTPIASVAIKTQVDTTITGVRFRDGARGEKGDELFTLDCRQIEADMKRVEAVINGAQATFEQAQRDVERYTDLVARNATPIVTLNNAQTQVNISKATAESNRAQLEKSGYLKSFPNLLGCVCGLHGTEREINAAVAAPEVSHPSMVSSGSARRLRDTTEVLS